eukprot:COSAG02_NODE_52720_length_306_cov_0.739130_1_plen_63_part_10
MALMTSSGWARPPAQPPRLALSAHTFGGVQVALTDPSPEDRPETRRVAVVEGPRSLHQEARDA